MSESKPSRLPPEDQTQTSGQADLGLARPRELSAEELTLISSTISGTTAPSLTPSGAVTAGAGATIWQGDKRINALWSINQNRNSWVSITNIGWKKLANNSDSAIVALTMLSALAKQTQTRVDYREEADGMIHEMYIW